MITSADPWPVQWKHYIQFSPNSSVEERIARLERRLTWDRSCLNSLQAHLMVCVDSEEEWDTQREIRYHEARVLRLERLIAMLETRAEQALFDRWLPR